MLSLLFFIASRNRKEIITVNSDATNTFEPGIYKFTLNAAAGGTGCQRNTQNTFGGNGAQVKASLLFIQKTTVRFIIGKKPIGGCILQNVGGHPNGGNSGRDTNFLANDATGGGGGMTAIMIDNDFILIAGGGAGGAGIYNGSHGGGFKYTMRVRVSDQVPEYDKKYFSDKNKGGDGANGYKTPGSGGGGGWPGGKGGESHSKLKLEVCGFGGVSGYNEAYQYYHKRPEAIDGRFTNNNGDGSAIVTFRVIRDTVPENNRKPRKILVASSMYMSFAASNLF